MHFTLSTTSNRIVCMTIRRNVAGSLSMLQRTTNPAEVTCERCKKTIAYKTAVKV